MFNFSYTRIVEKQEWKMVTYEKEKLAGDKEPISLNKSLCLSFQLEWGAISIFRASVSFKYPPPISGFNEQKMYNYTFEVIILLLDKQSIGIMEGHNFYNTKVSLKYNFFDAIADLYLIDCVDGVCENIGYFNADNNFISDTERYMGISENPDDISKKIVSFKNK